jgi:hypothetical protein
MSSQCQATTLKGTQCSRKATTGNFCKTHSKMEKSNVCKYDESPVQVIKNESSIQVIQLYNREITIHQYVPVQIPEPRQSQIVHGIRSNVKSVQVCFEPKEHQCKYRNVQGQYVCNEPQYKHSLCSEFCEQHFKEKNIFTGIFEYELNYMLMCYEEYDEIFR